MTPIFLLILLSFAITPQNPVVGDVVKISGTAKPNEEIAIKVTFEKFVDVSDGRYEFRLSSVKIPEGKNSFTVKAYGCDDLSVSVKIFFWITKTSKASNGVAVVSQSNVPAGSYDVIIRGKSNEKSVRLVIEAVGYVKADENGNFEFSYDTSSIPPGVFKVRVGAEERILELRSSGSYPPAPTDTVPAPIETPTETPTPEPTPTPTPAETPMETPVETSTPIETPTVIETPTEEKKLSFEPKSISLKAREGEELKAILKIYGNCSWSLRSNASWISFNTTSGNGNGSVEVALKTLGSSLKEGEIEIESDCGNAKIPVSLNVSQKIPIDPTPTIIALTVAAFLISRRL